MAKALVAYAPCDTDLLQSWFTQLFTFKEGGGWVTSMSEHNDPGGERVHFK